MSSYPEVSDNFFTEREGVIHVQQQLNQMRLIFRETPNKDVGIDGQAEYVNNQGEVTGKLVAVQIKSGDSYLNDKGYHWAYYPSDKHRNYWESFPLPVILIIHLPSLKATFFVDARHMLNASQYKLGYIAVPKANVLGDSSKEVLFEAWGDLNEKYLSIDEVLIEMALKRHSNPTFAISYFDLFSFGLINISRQLFFHMSIALDLAELANETERGLGIGDDEHNFLHSYVRFLLAQNLVKVDYADYLIDWNERLLQPMFIAPLTTWGRRLLDLILGKERQYFLNTLLTSERLIGIQDFSADARFQQSRNFTNRIINDLG